MENLRLAYCNECEDLVEYDICDELIEEEFRVKQSVTSLELENVNAVIRKSQQILIIIPENPRQKSRHIRSKQE